MINIRSSVQLAMANVKLSMREYLLSLTLT